MIFAILKLICLLYIWHIEAHACLFSDVWTSNLLTSVYHFTKVRKLKHRVMNSLRHGLSGKLALCPWIAMARRRSYHRWYRRSSSHSHEPFPPGTAISAAHVGAPCPPASPPMHPETIVRYSGQPSLQPLSFTHWNLLLPTLPLHLQIFSVRRPVLQCAI